MNRKYARGSMLAALATTLVLSVTGCGGGGGDKPSDNATKTAVPTTSGNSKGADSEGPIAFSVDTKAKPTGDANGIVLGYGDGTTCSIINLEVGAPVKMSLAAHYKLWDDCGERQGFSGDFTTGVKTTVESLSGAGADSHVTVVDGVSGKETDVSGRDNAPIKGASQEHPVFEPEGKEVWFRQYPGSGIKYDVRSFDPVKQTADKAVKRADGDKLSGNGKFVLRGNHRAVSTQSWGEAVVNQDGSVAVQDYLNMLRVSTLDALPNPVTPDEKYTLKGAKGIDPKTFLKGTASGGKPQFIGTYGSSVYICTVDKTARTITATPVYTATRPEMAPVTDGSLFVTDDDATAYFINYSNVTMKDDKGRSVEAMRVITLDLKSGQATMLGAIARPSNIVSLSVLGANS